MSCKYCRDSHSAFDPCPESIEALSPPSRKQVLTALLAADALGKAADGAMKTDAYRGSQNERVIAAAILSLRGEPHTEFTASEVIALTNYLSGK